MDIYLSIFGLLVYPFSPIFIDRYRSFPIFFDLSRVLPISLNMLNYLMLVVCPTVLTNAIESIFVDIEQNNHHSIELDYQIIISTIKISSGHKKWKYNIFKVIIDSHLVSDHIDTFDHIDTLKLYI